MAGTIRGTIYCEDELLRCMKGQLNLKLESSINENDISLDLFIFL